MLLGMVSPWKTKNISFRAEEDPAGFQLILLLEPVECVNNFKYLGVIFENRLDWNEHVMETETLFRL